jgi:Mrp family chromosome partitioning ATPase
VIAITSVAENEGKSTCAANIAVSLADRGNKVILLDLDFKKPALYKIFSEDIHI